MHGAVLGADAAAIISWVVGLEFSLLIMPGVRIRGEVVGYRVCMCAPCWYLIGSPSAPHSHLNTPHILFEQGGGASESTHGCVSAPIITIQNLENSGNQLISE